MRAPRVLHELAVSRGDGSYARLLTKLAKLDLLAIDDWLLASLTDAERRDLLEVIEDRSERRSTLIASQLPPTAWHTAIGEPSVADATCDRLIHHAHRLTLKDRQCATREHVAARRDHRDSPSACGLFWGGYKVDPTADRRSWGIVARRAIGEKPMDRAAGMEIAQHAIPTPAWTAPSTCRPQRSTRPTDRLRSATKT